MKSPPEDIPDDSPLDKELVLSWKLKSYIAIPSILNGEVCGSVNFASLRVEKLWPDVLIRRLQIIGEILANSLARKQSDEALRAEIEHRRQIEERNRTIIDLDINSTDPPFKGGQLFAFARDISARKQAERE